MKNKKTVENGEKLTNLHKNGVKTPKLKNGKKFIKLEQKRKITQNFTKNWSNSCKNCIKERKIAKLYQN